MKIAVIIPHRNGGAQFARCLQSLRAQMPIEGCDFEFITVDDNDDFGEDWEIAQLASQADDRVIALINEKAAGVSGARNTGIQWAIHRHADWITFLDADDTWLPDGTIAIQKAIEANEGAQIIELDHLRHYVELDKTAKKYSVWRGRYKFGTINRAWCFVWNKLYKTELIKDVRFVEGLQYGEDEIFNIDVLAKHNEIVHDDRFIALKRYFDNKQSLSHIKDQNELLAQNKALIRALMRHQDKPEIARDICMLIGEHWKSPSFLAKFAGGTQ